MDTCEFSLIFGSPRGRRTGHAGRVFFGLLRENPEASDLNIGFRKAPKTAVPL
jgi:hypothetical protein